MRSREQTLMQHLGELRRRVFICVIALLVGSAVSFVFFEQIIEVLVRPAKDLGLGTGGELIYTEVTELLTTAIKVSFVSGLVLASPIILFQVVMFIAPGLTGREKRYLFGFMPAVLLAFAGGVAFAYYVLTPPALHFLLTFGGDVAVPLIRISNIINLMIRL
jgi:sec-independent protein translocase protein TatC